MVHLEEIFTQINQIGKKLMNATYQISKSRAKIKKVVRLTKRKKYYFKKKKHLPRKSRNPEKREKKKERKMKKWKYFKTINFRGRLQNYIHKREDILLKSYP